MSSNVEVQAQNGVHLCWRAESPGPGVTQGTRSRVFCHGCADMFLDVLRCQSRTPTLFATLRARLPSTMAPQSLASPATLNPRYSPPINVDSFGRNRNTDLPHAAASCSQTTGHGSDKSGKYEWFTKLVLGTESLTGHNSHQYLLDPPSSH